jgi:hypothetical protein
MYRRLCRIINIEKLLSRKSYFEEQFPREKNKLKAYVYLKVK